MKLLIIALFAVSVYASFLTGAASMAYWNICQTAAIMEAPRK